MNCRQCGHFDLEGYQMGVAEWPCERGVASLPDGYFVRAIPGKYGLVAAEDSQPIMKLPWLIPEHDCPEFEEAV